MKRCVASNSRVPRSRVKVTLKGQSSNCGVSCLRHNFFTIEWIWIKLHRIVKHHEKVCRVQLSGPHVQGQCHYYEFLFWSSFKGKAYMLVPCWGACVTYSDVSCFDEPQAGQLQLHEYSICKSYSQCCLGDCLHKLFYLNKSKCI